MVVGKKTSKLSKKSKHQLQQQVQQQAPVENRKPTQEDQLPVSSVANELNPIELGYNSGDEYERAATRNWSPKEIEEAEKRFEKKMRKKGFIIKKMAEDGACLFRAVADQLYGDQDMHQCVRKLCMDYMAKNADYFSHYVTEDFSDYIKRKRLNNSHGNHIEIQALSEMFNRPIEVYHYNCEPINILPGGPPQSDTVPIRLSYHQNVHYNSVVDPYKATIGVGLGLPSFKPGSADRNILEKAMRLSEEQELEKVMLEDKMKLTDWEATNEAIEEQIARESYVQWLRDNERRLSKNKKVKFTATATATTTTVSSSSTGSPSREEAISASSSSAAAGRGSPRLSPVNGQSPKASSSGVNVVNAAQYDRFGIVENTSFVNQFPPQMFGINDWDNDDGDILRQVLAQSQQEYLDTLKRKARSSSPSTPQASTSGTGTSSCSSPAKKSNSSLKRSAQESEEGNGGMKKQKNQETDSSNAAKPSEPGQLNK